MRKVPFQLAHLSLAGATFELAQVHKVVNVAQVGSLIAAVPLDTNYPPRFYTLEGTPVGDYKGSALLTCVPPVEYQVPFSWERYLELKGKGVKVLTREGMEVTQLVKFEGVTSTHQPLRGVSQCTLSSWTPSGNWHTNGARSNFDLTTLEWEED